MQYHTIQWNTIQYDAIPPNTIDYHSIPSTPIQYRIIKVWNLDYIFEKEHHIDKHELTIDSLSISTSAQLAVVVTRSCIGRQAKYIYPNSLMEILLVRYGYQTVLFRYLGFYDWEAEVQAGQLSARSHHNTCSGQLDKYFVDVSWPIFCPS